MTYLEALDKVKQYDQQHLLQYYDLLNDEDKEQLLSQIEQLDFSLLQLLNHIEENNVRGIIEPLEAIEVKEILLKKDYFVNLGLEYIQKCKVAAVLLAGGQGTRLGFDKPKGMLNVGLTKELYLFEKLIKNTMEVTKMAGCFVPFYIMTSEKNHDDTVSFFEQHQYFGYDKDYIKFFKQEMAPSVDFNGKILMEDKARISLSPNGNGGWFLSMKKSGVLEDAKNRGVEWINIFSVDNVLQQIADPCFVGAVLDSGCVSGSKVVKKNDPNERVGVLCKEDGKPSIVEYYEMTDEMITGRKENGELQYAFGVILNYLFKLDQLEYILNKRMPTHIVEKKIPYMNEHQQYINPDQPNGYKFEQLVLDMIHLLDNCLPYEIVREKEFAPIKNKTGVDSLESAREIMKSNGIEL